METLSYCQLMERCIALEAEVAELKGREVRLPQGYSMLYRTDFGEPYHTEMVYKQHQVLEALQAAGIRINGEY